MAFTLTAAGQGWAAGQDKTPDNGSEITEVVVTARGRKEKLLETPVAISAMSAEKIEQIGATSLTDVARYTPGMTENSTITSSGRNDRSFSQFILRGIMPSDVDIPTTTTFLDGAPLSAGAVDGVDDLERIETLKGPQAAYFGRQTFGGAISLVTKDPASAPALTLNGILGSQNLTEGRITLEGPIGDGDKLAARLSYRYSDQDGYYKNSATWRTHERVGDRQTQNVNLTVVATPVDNLKIKFTGMYRHDKDGPSAQVYIPASYSNCTTAAGSWFCGKVPSAPKTIMINDVVTPTIKSFIADAKTTGNQVKTIDEFGLERDAFHGGLNAEYYAPDLDLTFVSITGVDQQVFGQMQDFDNQDSQLVNYVFAVSKRNRNLSQEFRVVSNQDNAFRWLVGASYAWQRVDTSLASSLLAFGAANNSYTPSSSSSSQTLAGFFGLTYDLTKKLTLNLEGRYQSDEVNSGGQSATYKTFLPRAIAQYHFTDRVMGYATYSKGVNPGPFNSPRALDALTAENRADFVSRYGFGVEVLPEKLQNFEAGLKGTFFDGKLSLAADAYYDEWTNQINYVSRYYTQGANLVGVFAKVNNGKIKLSGIEVEGNYRPVRGVDINFGGAINDTNIRAGSCISCNEITGNPDTHVYRGNELNNVSKYQSILGASYFGALKALPGADWFANINYSYKSGSYVSNDNLLKTPDQHTVDVRTGVTKGALTTELFVRNLFDQRYFTNATTFYNVVTLDFSRANALLAGIAPGRSFGVRLKYVWR
jgi:iron complex outermembrane receptor protein